MKKNHKNYTTNNTAVSEARGKVGNIRYYTKDGKTFIRKVHNEGEVTRTEAQMRQRTRWANAVNCYREGGEAIRKCFQDADKNISSYNFYLKHNMPLTEVYLTKEQANEGYAIAFPMKVSEGNLSAISYSLVNGKLETTISVGTLVLSNTTTIGELSYAIVKSNHRRFKEGDTISFYGLFQETNTSIPRVYMTCDSLKLDITSTVVLSTSAYAPYFNVQNGHLAVRDTLPLGCFGWVHGRGLNFPAVSTQILYNNNEALIEEYSSDESFLAASLSYGEFDVLAPVVSGEPDDDGSTPTPPTPTTPVTITAKVATGQEAQGTVKAGSSAAGATSSVTVEKDTSVQVVATPASGYKFKQWNTGETTATLNLIANADTTVTATFEPDSPTGTVTVTLTSADASQGKVQINIGEVGATATATVQSGAATVIKAIPEAGYTFSKWSDGGLQFERTINPTEDVSLTATFEAE